MRRFETWTSSQRGVLIALLCALLVVISVKYALNPAHIGDPQPEHPPRYGDLADRIDPNVADVHALAALPMIGPARAGEIVAYREDFLREHPGGIAFTAPEDLMEVHGIGVAITTLLQPYLIFPEPAEALSGGDEPLQSPLERQIE